MILPTVTIGDGRTYASAARKPGAFVSSGGDWPAENFEDIEGVLNRLLRLLGFTVASSENSFLVLGPASATRFVEEPFGGDDGIERGRGDKGRGLSSRENIDRSSPFH